MTEYLFLGDWFLKSGSWMHLCRWKSMEDATHSPISLCNIGYWWKNVQSSMSPACTALFKHSIVMVKPTLRCARWSLHAWLQLLRAVSRTCLFSQKHFIVPNQPVFAQSINTLTNPKQRKVLLHMRLNDSCHPPKNSFRSRLITILDVTACYSKTHMLKLY